METEKEGSMPDTRVYKAGEEIMATLTLEPGHIVPTGVWLYLNLQPEAGATPAAPLANRIAYLTLQSGSATLGTPSAPPGGSLTITVQAKIPNHIVGGVYKPTSALFFMPDGSQRQVPEPDPDGDFVRHIADDPPTAFDTPVIKDLD